MRNLKRIDKLKAEYSKLVETFGAANLCICLGARPGYIKLREEESYIEIYNFLDDIC